MSKDEMVELMQSGKGLMPAFPQLDKKEKHAIVEYLINSEVGSGVQKIKKPRGQAPKERMRFAH